MVAKSKRVGEYSPTFVGFFAKIEDAQANQQPSPIFHLPVMSPMHSTPPHAGPDFHGGPELHGRPSSHDGPGPHGSPDQSPPGANPPPIRRWVIRTGRLALLAFMVLSTFAVLTAGMSEPQREKAQDLLVTEANISGVQPTSVSSETEASFVAGHGYDRDYWRGVLEEAWRERLQAASLAPAPMADWLTVSRRLSLAMVGSGLSLEEIRDLQQVSEQERFQRHRNKLLQDARFHDYWAERLTRYLVGADDGPFLVYRRRRFRTWLSDQLAENVRYDQLVRNLITAEGLFTDRPEVNFHTVTFDSGDGSPDPVRMAARMSRAFLGVRIDCLQCHDDFLGNVSMGDPVWMTDLEADGETGDFREGTQQDFHGLAAFFTAAGTEGLQGLKDKPADYNYQFLDADEEVEIVPQVPFRRDLLPPMEYGKDSRRRLAQWLTHPENVQFARATVNRVWTLLFGGPSGEGVDDLPLDQPPTPLMMSLTRAFIESGYDTRELIHLITDLPAFHVDSKADFEITRQHERALAAFPVVRLRAEQVAGAITQAGRVKTIDRDSAFFVQLQRFGDTNEFLKRYGDLGEDEFNQESVTITQRLVMLNGKLTRETASWNPVLNATSHVGMFASDDAKAVETLYLTGLNRFPTASETEHFVRRIGEADTRKQGFVDIVWVLFNSSEFSWNH